MPSHSALSDTRYPAIRNAFAIRDTIRGSPPSNYKFDGVLPRVRNDVSENTKPRDGVSSRDIDEARSERNFSLMSELVAIRTRIIKQERAQDASVCSPEKERERERERERKRERERCGRIKRGDLVIRECNSD